MQLDKYNACLQCKARVEPSTPPLGRCSKMQCNMLHYDVCSELISAKLLFLCKSPSKMISLSVFGPILHQMAGGDEITEVALLKFLKITYNETTNTNIQSDTCNGKLELYMCFTAYYACHHLVSYYSILNITNTTDTHFQHFLIAHSTNSIRTFTALVQYSLNFSLWIFVYLYGTLRGAPGENLSVPIVVYPLVLREGCQGKTSLYFI